jgi:hypothetical protein
MRDAATPAAALESKAESETQMDLCAAVECSLEVAVLSAEPKLEPTTLIHPTWLKRRSATPDGTAFAGDRCPLTMRRS